MLPAVGLRVMMTDPCDGRGEGCIESVHANGGYCAVLWDSGCRDVCLFTGMQNEFHLAAAPAHPDSEASSREALPGIVHISLPAGTDSPAMLEASPAAEPAGDKGPASATGEMGALGEHATASVQEGDTSDYFQRRILAREVIQMRAEVARLQAQRHSTTAGEKSTVATRSDLLMLQAQYRDTRGRCARDRQLLEDELHDLLHETDVASPWCREYPSHKTLAHFSVDAQNAEHMPHPADQEAEERALVAALRGMRTELESTSIRHLAGACGHTAGVKPLLQVSADKLQQVIADAKQFPVTSDLHLEALRLVVENARLRATINGYSEQFLAIATAREEMHALGRIVDVQQRNVEMDWWERAMAAGKRFVVGWGASDSEKRHEAWGDRERALISCASGPELSTRPFHLKRERDEVERRIAEEEEHARFLGEQELRARQREEEERVEKEWWLEEQRASEEGAALLAAADAAALTARTRNHVFQSHLDYKWQLKQAEGMEAARRLRGKDFIGAGGMMWPGDGQERAGTDSIVSEEAHVPSVEEPEAGSSGLKALSAALGKLSLNWSSGKAPRLLQTPSLKPDEEDGAVKGGRGTLFVPAAGEMRRVSEVDVRATASFEC